MSSSDEGSTSRSSSRREWFLMPWRLSWVALVLFALYGTIVLGDALPLQLSDPAWQLRLYNSVVNASSLPLVGLALLHLAASLAPDNKSVVRRARLFARLAAPIALGFLLLIPLQAYLHWQQSDIEASVSLRQLERQERTLASLRQAVQQAGSAVDLQQRLKTLQGPELSPAERSLPLPQLRAQLNVSLDQADRVLQRQRAQLPAADPLKLRLLVLRNGLACLALAIGFAALAQRRHSPVALLMEWQDLLEDTRHRRPWKRRSVQRD
jgi:hypothetical protein